MPPLPLLLLLLAPVRENQGGFVLLVEQQRWISDRQQKTAVPLKLVPPESLSKPKTTTPSLPKSLRSEKSIHNQTAAAMTRDSPQSTSSDPSDSIQVQRSKISVYYHLFFGTVSSHWNVTQVRKQLSFPRLTRANGPRLKLHNAPLIPPFFSSVRAHFI